MPEFTYKARTATGEDIVGTMTASNKREMLCALADRSLFPLRVDCAAPPRPRWQMQKRVKAQLIATNLSQLADLLKNGVPLLHALEILSGQAAHRTLTEVLNDVHDQIAEGTPLDEAFARHPNVFSELTVSMVRAGSEGAFLEDALYRTAHFLELQEQLKARVKGAMAYPIFLGVAGFCVVVVLIVFFVPKFAGLFARLERQGTGLPTATIVLLWLSKYLGRYGLFLGAAAGGLSVWLRRLARTERGRAFTDRWKLKIPIAGRIFLDSAVSRFCRVLGTLLHNGVPLLRAMEISSDSAGNRVLSEAIRKSAENISSGETLAKPLAECGLIPRNVMAMISIAEESNNLDEVLVNIAEGLDQTISRQLDMMVRLVEPMMLMVMGAVILFVLVALLLPVFDMSSAMG
jgi:general secretion pathway protein F/type IV pilus assembly protein PilC